MAYCRVTTFTASGLSSDEGGNVNAGTVTSWAEAWTVAKLRPILMAMRNPNFWMK
jgi:hypothetical protein